MVKLSFILAMALSVCGFFLFLIDLLIAPFVAFFGLLGEIDVML